MVTETDPSIVLKVAISQVVFVFLFYLLIYKVSSSI